MAPFVHKFLTYSQYVAPLMANFDTQTANSDILYKKYSEYISFRVSFVVNAYYQIELTMIELHLKNRTDTC